MRYKVFLCFLFFLSISYMNLLSYATNPFNSLYEKVTSAIKSNDTDRLERLFGQGANINSVDKANWTPLHWAASCGHIESTKCLISRGANLNARTKYQNTPLYFSAGSSLSVSNLLLSLGSDVNSRNQNGETPLFQAVRKNRSDIVRFLICYGAEIEARNDGLTPLMLAKKEKYQECIKLLEEAQRVKEYGLHPEYWKSQMKLTITNY